MSSNLDRSLDEILDDKKKAARRNKNVKKPAPSGGIKKQRASSRIQQQQQKKVEAKKVVETNKKTDTKIQVSNLPLDVNEAMLREYFSSVVGPIKKCHISYTAAGKSTGVAQLEFAQVGAANNAFEQFNGRLVDNRPMKVEIIVDPGKVPFASRVGAAPKPKAAPKPAPRPAAGKPKPATANGKPGAAGRGGRKGARGGRSGSGAKRSSKTVEQLDQEMADYYKSAEGAAAPAAAAPAPTAAQASAMEDL